MRISLVVVIGVSKLNLYEFFLIDLVCVPEQHEEIVTTRISITPVFGLNLLPSIFSCKRISLEVKNSLALALRSASSTYHLNCFSMSDGLVICKNKYLSLSSKLEIVASSKSSIKDKNSVHSVVVKSFLLISIIFFADLDKRNLTLFANVLQLLYQFAVILSHEQNEGTFFKIIFDQLQYGVLKL